MSRWRDPQLQVSENYSDLTKLRSTLFKSCWLMSHVILNIIFFIIVINLFINYQTKTPLPLRKRNVSQVKVSSRKVRQALRMTFRRLSCETPRGKKDNYRKCQLEPFDFKETKFMPTMSHVSHKLSTFALTMVHYSTQYHR